MVRKPLYMPRAEYSLREHMKRGIDGTEAMAILLELANGLNEISSVVVHRDIKPENCLFVDGTGRYVILVSLVMRTRPRLPGLGRKS